MSYPQEHHCTLSKEKFFGRFPNLDTLNTALRISAKELWTDLRKLTIYSNTQSI